MKIEHPIKSMESPVQFDVFYKLRSSVSWGHLFTCRPQLNFRLAAIRVNGVIKTVWAVRTSAVMRRSLFSWPPQTNVYLSLNNSMQGSVPSERIIDSTPQNVGTINQWMFSEFYLHKASQSEGRQVNRQLRSASWRKRDLMIAYWVLMLSALPLNISS